MHFGKGDKLHSPGSEAAISWPANDAGGFRLKKDIHANFLVRFGQAFRVRAFLFMNSMKVAGHWGVRREEMMRAASD
jgi:hypothetical protein